MGEVYKAHDTRLDRTVALKVMGAALADIDHGAMLEQEARAVAALNHPHICALHDVGREQNTAFLVMEYVKGETLASRLSGGPLPIRDVVRFGIQIAEALDHAHRQGVIHRDLKPANIMLTTSGVKVLDFGLATLRAAAPLQMPLEGTPTVKHPLTSERALLGTIQYISPERLEGREADASSDLFAFGAVMYEMTTGRRPFDSPSPAGVIAAIMNSDPPRPSALRPDVPAPLEWLIQKALAKNPDARWQAAGDVVEVLRWIARGIEPGVRRRRPLRSAVPLAAALVLVAGAAFLAVVRPFPAAHTEPATLTFSIAPPDGGGFTPTPSSVPTPQFALSPNGRRLAFVASLAHEPAQLWLRALDSLIPEPLAGTNGAEYPFWSPDSASIGFFANGMLKRIDLAGGPARVLASAPFGRGGTWSRSGIILFAPNTQGGVYRVPANGGEATLLTHVDAAAHEASHRWPQFLPDDRHFLYFVQSTPPQAHGVCVADLDGSPPRKLLTSGLSASFVPPDHLLYVADDALMATTFDAATQRAVGDSFPVVSSIAGSSNFFAAVSASSTGLLAYASSSGSSALTWYDRTGRASGSVGPPGEYVDFRLSPRSDQLAVAEVEPQTHRPDIRVMDLMRGAKLRLTSEAATDASPVWSPDAARIVFRSNPEGLHDLYLKPANGAGERALLLKTSNAKYPTDWTSDGRTIVYHTDQRGTGIDIWTVGADGSHPTPLVQTPFDEVQGQVSRNGRWIAYTSLETGRPEVYIRSMTDPGVRWQVSADGGTDPRWRADARELFYLSLDSWVTAVGFAGERATAPHRLFPVRVAPPGDPYLSNYDVTADGQRFLVKVPVRDVTSTPIHIVTNWLAASKPRS